MPYDEIAEGIFRVAGRAVGQFLAEIVFDIICFHIGKPVVRLATLGRHPDPEPTSLQEGITSTVGLLVLLAVPLAISEGWLHSSAAP